VGSKVGWFNKHNSRGYWDQWLVVVTENQQLRRSAPDARTSLYLQVEAPWPVAGEPER